MPRKSGHHAEGVGAFKDHRTGRYFAAYCDDNGWSPDDAEPLAAFTRWVDACLWVENEAVKQRKAHAKRKAWGDAIGRRLMAEARANKGVWPEIRKMNARRDSERMVE